MNYFWAFCVGGGICVVGQLLIDLTGLTPARILTGYVVAGVVLSAIGWYAHWPSLQAAGPQCRCWASATCWQKGCAPHWRKREPWASSLAGSLPLRPALPPALCAAWCAPGWARATTRTEKTA